MDTKVPTGTFELGVSGVEDYDVVRAEQVVRNVEDGWLVRWLRAEVLTFGVTPKKRGASLPKHPH